MIVYILRHAEAVEGNGTLPDEWRYLTEKGEKEAEGIAKRLARRGLKTGLILSSPLVRAVQTSQIVADKCGRKCRIEINGLLQPGNGIAELAEFLRSRADAKNILVTGHEPQLGGLAAMLLKCEETIQLKKGSCIILELNPGKPEKPAKFCSCLTPGKKPVKSLKKSFATT